MNARWLLPAVGLAVLGGLVFTIAEVRGVGVLTSSEVAAMHRDALQHAESIRAEIQAASPRYLGQSVTYEGDGWNVKTERLVGETETEWQVKHEEAVRRFSR